MPPTAWNAFVKKIYQEGKAKNPNYEFKQALVDASKRKSEMGSQSPSPAASGVKSKKRNYKKSSRKSRKSRKSRRRH